MEAENTGSQVKVPVKKTPRERKKRNDYDVSKNAEGKKVANCKRCRKEFVAESTDGTTHLSRHLKTCPRRQDGASLPVAAPPPIDAPPEASKCSNPADLPTPAAAPPPTPEAPPIGSLTESSNCTKAADWEEATVDLARMIALHGYDPSIVDDSYFRSFVRRLNPDFQVPSRANIEDICDGVFDEAWGVLESELERTSGKVNLAIDTAKTALGKVLYAAYHFIDDDWNRRLMIFNVNNVIPEDMGPIPLSVRGCKLSSNYDAQIFGDIISEDSVSDGFFSKAIGRIDHLDKCGLDARYETAYNHNDALEMVASCFFNNIDSENVAHIYEEAMLYAVTRQVREEFFSQLGLDYLSPYDKGWISCYCSLHAIRENIRSLDESEELMCKVLGKIYRAIKTISDPNRATSNIVLGELFKVRETLQSLLAAASGDGADLYKSEILEDDLVVVTEKAEEILDRSIKKEYLQWAIPLALDPRYKLKYIRFIFSRAFRSEAEEYIDNITEEMEELFTCFSIDADETTDANPIHETEITRDPLERAWDEENCSSEVTKTELDRYLEEPPVRTGVSDDFDILNWWKLKSSEYPTLARMARAALAMPTSSKLSSEQTSQITSMIRGYSKKGIFW